MWRTAAILATGIITAVPLADDDVLEPSVRNEVEHAISAAERHGAATNAFSCVSAFREAYPTGGMSRSAVALKLVSAQRSDGRWLAGTNDVTASALEVLKSL
jgi:hypothetical protein